MRRGEAKALARVDELLAEMEGARATVRELKKDQADWRKGVALIASALGEKDPPDLCCVRLSRVALEMRAALERATLERAARPHAELQEKP